MLAKKILLIVGLNMNFCWNTEEKLEVELKVSLHK